MEIVILILAFIIIAICIFYYVSTTSVNNSVKKRIEQEENIVDNFRVRIDEIRDKHMKKIDEIIAGAESRQQDTSRELLHKLQSARNDVNSDPYNATKLEEFCKAVLEHAENSGDISYFQEALDMIDRCRMRGIDSPSLLSVKDRMRSELILQKLSVILSEESLREWIADFPLSFDKLLIQEGQLRNTLHELERAEGRKEIPDSFEIYNIWAFLQCKYAEMRGDKYMYQQGFALFTKAKQLPMYMKEMLDDEDTEAFILYYTNFSWAMFLEKYATLTGDTNANREAARKYGELAKLPEDSTEIEAAKLYKIRNLLTIGITEKKLEEDPFTLKNKLETLKSPDIRKEIELQKQRLQAFLNTTEA